MDEQYRNWLWEKNGQTCVKSLRRNGFEAHLVKTGQMAVERVLDLVSGQGTFGFGGSSTVRNLDLPQLLARKGKTVYDHWQEGLDEEADREIRLMQGRCDCFFCSANAISMTGEIVNVDGLGNRTAAMTFGPRQVVIIAGMNKVTPDLDSALRRVRDVAAPMRAKSLDLGPPCTETGQCEDCHSPHRICRVTTILHRKPMATDVAVFLVQEPMGF